MPLHRRWVAYGLASVLLGGIGSGVWEYVLRPALTGGTSLLLNLATLGSHAFKDDLYREVALGYQETPSLTLLANFTGMLLAVVLILLARRVGLRDPSSRLSRTATAIGRSKLTVMLVLFLVGALSVDAIRQGYVNGAIAYYKQMSSVVAPYQDETQARTLRSRFALVQSKADYDALIQALQATATRAGVRFPSRRP